MNLLKIETDKFGCNRLVFNTGISNAEELNHIVFNGYDVKILKHNVLNRLYLFIAGSDQDCVWSGRIISEQTMNDVLNREIDPVEYVLK